MKKLLRVVRKPTGGGGFWYDYQYGEEKMPTCAKCGMPMNPANSKIRPELFLHDACLPTELAQQKTNQSKTLTRQVEEMVDKKIKLEGLASEIIATLQVNIDRGYIVTSNDQGKLNIARIVEKWKRELDEIKGQ